MIFYMRYLIDKINEIGNSPRVSSGRASSRAKEHPLRDHAPPLARQPPLRGLLPPLQPPRARSSFNKRSSEALSNYIYSLLGRKLPTPGQRGKNWEIKINPYRPHLLLRPGSAARACSPVQPPFSDCAPDRNTSFSNLGGAGGHYRLRNLFLHSDGGSLLAKLFSTRFALLPLLPPSPTLFVDENLVQHSSIISGYCCQSNTNKRQYFSVHCFISK
ncbi:hypothetical protein PUN28_010610 [Cardiocondyla obscurior]|uniref:Uncharacterized protein n=1 Tax=Cardiocondyla obscurior TaxID=286306 RepID=A0AAW2FLU1_9HYME